jgi:hypothetical protein
MRAGVVLIGLAFLLAIGYYAIDMARGWKGAGAPPAVDAPVTLAPALDDPHAPPRLEYWPPPAATGALPRLVVEPAELDFGRVPVQGQRERRVLIANEGTGPLEISQGATTCEATLSDRPGETLPPGERRALVVRWSPSSATEGEDQFLEIRSNDPAHPKFKLKLKGRAAVPLALSLSLVLEVPELRGVSPASADLLGQNLASVVFLVILVDLVIQGLLARHLVRRMALMGAQNP